MGKRLLTAVLLFISPFLYAEDYPGRVMDELREGVPFATVVLVDLDLIVTTGKDGSFTFHDIEKGTYTILALAPGFEEWKESVDLEKDTLEKDALDIVLSPEVVEMDTIVVTAETPLSEDILDNEVSKDELERLRPRSNPFDAVGQEIGILEDIGSGVANPNMPRGPFDGTGPDSVIEINIDGGTLGRINMNQRDANSVYGGESDWNNYFYDYIRIPANTHTFGYPVPDAVVPMEAIDEVAIYKGATPVEHGPAIGGTFVMEPATATEGFSATISPSIMDVSFISTWKMDDLFFLLSANQSIVQYTVLPLIALLVPIDSEVQVSEEGEPTSFTYGDALFRVLYSPPDHSLSLDVVAYYDSWLFDLSFEDFILYSKYGPYYAAAGSRWRYSPSATLANTLYAYGSYYRDFGDYDFHFPATIDLGTESFESDEFYDLRFDWTTKVTAVQAGDELLWNISDSSALLLGANARLADLNGDYTEVVLRTNAQGAEVSNETLVLPGLDEWFFSGYGYAKFFGRSERFKYRAGGGLLWYPSHQLLRPAITGEVVYTGTKFAAAFGAGWSPGAIDEFGYISRRLDEQYYNLDSVTSLGRPPMAVSTAGQVAYLISEAHTLNASPYFAWYYDLSGIGVNTSGFDIDGSFISYEPQKGYSTGIDFGWKTRLSDYLNLSLSYAYSHTRYYTQEWGWVPPNTQVSHALKSGLLYKRGGFILGQNLLIHSGMPFTPEVVVENELGDPETVQGDYNSAFNYVPTFDVQTNASYTWSFEAFDMRLFIASSNWLNVANGLMMGIDPAKQETVGATSTIFGDREYSYSLTWTDLLINLLLSEIGLSFSF